MRAQLTRGGLKRPYTDHVYIQETENDTCTTFFVQLTVKNCFEKWGPIYMGALLLGGPFYWRLF